MGAWKLIAGFLLIQGFLSIQALKANGMIFPDFRQTEPGTPENIFMECAMNWFRTIGGVSCSANGAENGMKLNAFILNYMGEAYGTEVKKIFSQICQPDLECKGDKCVCEDPSKNLPACNPTFSKQDLKLDCENQTRAFVRSSRQRANKDGLTGTALHILPGPAFITPGPDLHITPGPDLHITPGPVTPAPVTPAPCHCPGKVSRNTGHFPYIILMAIILFILAAN